MDFKPNPAGQEAIMKMARQKLQLACASLVNHIKTVTLSKGRRGQGDFLAEGMPPYLWSGALRNSVSQRWKEGDPNTQQVGSWTVRYARVQEQGANIHGSRGLLTIPRTDEAIAHLKGGGTARSFPRPLKLIPSYRRPGIFFLIEERRGGSKNPRRTEIHFVLARNVRIPPHPWLVPSVHEHKDTMLKIMGS